jgi:hypothetical protein
MSVKGVERTRYKESHLAVGINRGVVEMEVGRVWVWQIKDTYAINGAHNKA